MPGMKTNIALLIGMMLAAALLTPARNAQSRRNRSTSISAAGDRTVADCGDIHVRYGRRDAITEESSMTIPQAQAATLSARTANSGIYVAGWDRNEYQVKTCKAVPDDDPNSAELLRLITTTHSNGQLTVDGPPNREWTASLIIMVPRISKLQFQTSNGPLHLRDLAGTIQLNAANGPIHLENVGGSVQATTLNGPIHLERSSGDHRLSAANGPIDVSLSGSRWEGPGLQVTTKNGPLSVGIPDSYSSGVIIEVSDRSPVRCTAPACSSATRSLSSPGYIRIGSGDPLLRFSTVNGPVSITHSRD